MWIYLSVLVCIVGLVVYALAQTAKPAEIGRLMFKEGLLVSLLLFGARAFKLL